MGDFLKSQHLWCITTSAPESMQPVEAIAGNPTPAEALLQAAKEQELGAGAGHYWLSHLADAPSSHEYDMCRDMD